jgi:hypothetical protein
MGKNVNLEALKTHLFEALEGIKNQNDPEASDCEKITIEQAKAIVDVADSIIDIYKVQVDAVRMVGQMDHLNAPGAMLVGMGVTGEDEVKRIM